MPGELRRVLVANRGEIALRVFRACTELELGTLAIYAHEDRYAMHRFKADEAYEVGRGRSPVEAYLDIEDIIRVARDRRADAIHPGYGFLSENPDFARACEENGLVFVGPTPEQLEICGDKVASRRLARAAGVPTIPGTDEPVTDPDEAVRIAKSIGFPVLVKAAAGGGGRGIRRVDSPEELALALRQAQSEAEASFGSGAVYLEKHVDRARHIEVQVLGDGQGGLVHLFDRDCSVQRRHQKVLEVAPAVNLGEEQRALICAAAVRLLKELDYRGAGTVEFLADDQGEFYFLEVNPRIQVEHTITELITQIDLVQCQLRIAAGQPLGHPDIALPGQHAVHRRGYALQCRITTEDPKNGFVPDTGRITTCRLPAGFGIRVDEGNAAEGAVVTPHYDSLLVKVSAWSDTFPGALGKMERALEEFRVRGVRTNVRFLRNVLSHPVFRAGQADVGFVDRTPELLDYPEPRDRATRLARYIGEVTVNGSESLPPEGQRPAPSAQRPRPAVSDGGAAAAGGEGTAADPGDQNAGGSQAGVPSWRRLLEQGGPEAVCRAIQKESRLLLTDTTYRDAHQSLLATRVRTSDLLEEVRLAGYLRQAFSVEMWGGATFDTALRFLKESPWQRLQALREARPEPLFQMLLRGSNGVGYANVPDNVVRAFVEEAAAHGINLFRIFDCFNNVENMKVAVAAALETGQLVEGALCYSGDLADPREQRFTLDYYLSLAEELRAQGVHLLAIKDMAGLLKPRAARELVAALKKEIGLPVHLHTHDTTGNGLPTLLAAVEAGVDVVDAAVSSMSGLTSQPSLNALVAALQGDPREPRMDLEALDRASGRWEQRRRAYRPFESDLQASTTEVYYHEMPGGQYSNLRAQAAAVGLQHRWPDVVRAYRDVDRLLGRIVKVTPTSKAVGDMALFLVQHDLPAEALSEENLATPEGWAQAARLSFPASFVQMLAGEMGLPREPFPPLLQKVVLQGRAPLTERPGATLPPVDLDAAAREIQQRFGDDTPPSRADTLSRIFFEAAYDRWREHQLEYGDTSVLDTWTFFYGLEPGEEIDVEIEPGKRLFIRLGDVGAADSDGRRVVHVEVNGLPRQIPVVDRSLAKGGVSRRQANRNEPEQLGAPMAGRVIAVEVAQGQEVSEGQVLLTLEAMKMQLAVRSPHDGVVTALTAGEGDDVAYGELLAIVRRQAGEKED